MAYDKNVPKFKVFVDVGSSHVVVIITSSSGYEFRLQKINRNFKLNFKTYYIAHYLESAHFCHGIYRFLRNSVS